MKIRILYFGLSRFPKLTKEEQVEKVMGEIKEHYAEQPFTEKWYYELADVYIAATHGWVRFGDLTCKFIMEQIENREDFCNLINYVEEKMNINEGRTWNGSQHVKKKTIKRINYKTGVITEEEIDA